MKINYIFKIIITSFLIIAFTMSIISCKEAPAVEEAPAIEDAEEPEEEEIVDETPIEEEPVIDMDKVKFWEAIVDGEKSYDISDKILDYPSEEITILSDFINGKITYDEQINKFWKLANRVQEDFFLVEMMIGGRLKERGIDEPDKDMQKIIDIIVEWSEKTEDTYVYYAKYLDTDQAEYDFKVDELKEETSAMHTEYLELRHPYILEYNEYYDIE